ncbi:class I SAM-dependent methyltransferase [Novosphingobium sp. BL-8H]|uniref:class I SAM-dependent methyltransferase n=1 Tax=Novosphingobium sp. BL-8H TaxID=3127640 RepID=UPI00375750CB
MLEGANAELFSELIVTCDGMLSPQVYARVYETAQRGGVIVEVGTALGAATVALALGLQSSGKPGHVFTFDPMTGGPRRSIKTAEQRIARIEKSLAHYGVADRVTITPQDLVSGLAALPKGEDVSVLMLDADGRIDRDLQVLHGRCASDCSMIIDDVADRVRVKRRGATYRIDSKMRLSWLLTNMLISSGKLSSGQRLVDTYFGELTCDPLQIIEPGDALAVYRQLVFQSASANRIQRLRSRVLEWGQDLAPDLAARCRRVYRHVKYGPAHSEPAAEDGDQALEDEVRRQVATYH